MNRFMSLILLPGPGDVQDGVKVGRLSGLRNPVSEQQIETQSLQQYRNMKSQAGQQGALAPDDHPQVLRLSKPARVPRAIPWH